MFGSWFKPGDESTNVPGPQSTGSGASLSPSQPHLESRPSLHPGLTTAISTPHDAVLTELISQRTDLDSNARINEVPDTASLRDEDVTTESRQRTRSPTREPVLDPFTGSAIIGLALPEEDEVDFESTKDDLWTHMAHIREVQSQIANMHVVMEGIRLGPQGEQGTTGRSVPLVRPSEGEKWEEGEDSEDGDAEEKKARELDFSKLAEKFNGRREATDNIMRKV
jgi:hypothetical protein